MSASPAQSNSPVAGDDRNLVRVDDTYLAPTFEDKVRIFWDRNGRWVTAVLTGIALVLVGRWAFELYAEHREAQTRAAYAAAGDSAGLRAFIAEHPRTPLAGVAKLRLADEAYQAGDFAGAAVLYREAVPLLKADPLAGRARLGVAIALLLKGDSAASVELEGLANDTAAPAVLRAEAAYHRAVVARDAGQAEVARTWATLATTVDVSGLWSQRAQQLLGRLPVPASVPEAASAAEEGSKVEAVTEGESLIRVNIPGVPPK